MWNYKWKRKINLDVKTETGLKDKKDFKKERKRYTLDSRKRGYNPGVEE